MAYEKVYGRSKADYAREAFSKWKSGKTQMSCTVAERLFKLLPNMMPLDYKYSLVESLWKHVGPTKKRIVKCGGSTPVDKVVSTVEQEVMKLVTDWDIPDGLTNRFKWLEDLRSLLKDEATKLQATEVIRSLIEKIVV